MENILWFIPKGLKIQHVIAGFLFPQHSYYSKCFWFTMSNDVKCLSFRCLPLPSFSIAIHTCFWGCKKQLWLTTAIKVKDLVILCVRPACHWNIFSLRFRVLLVQSVEIWITSNGPHTQDRNMPRHAIVYRSRFQNSDVTSQQSNFEWWSGEHSPPLHMHKSDDASTSHSLQVMPIGFS